MRLAHTHFNLLLIDMILVCIFVCLRSVWSQSCLSGLLTTVGDSKETHIAKNSSLNATFCGQYSFSGKPTGSTSNRSCFTISYRIPSDREYEYLSFKERDVWQHKFGCDVKGTLCNHQESGKCSKRVGCMDYFLLHILFGIFRRNIFRPTSLLSPSNYIL